MIIYFVIQSVLTGIFYMFWAFNCGLPGGEVGFTPFVIITAFVIQIVLGTIFHFLCSKYINTINKKIGILFLYTIGYEFVMLYLNGFIPIVESFNDSINGEINGAYSLTSIFAFIFTSMIIFTNDNKLNSTNKKSPTH